MYAEVDAGDPTGLRDKIGETVYQGWLELEAVLARLWNHTRSARNSCTLYPDGQIEERDDW